MVQVRICRQEKPDSGLYDWTQRLVAGSHVGAILENHEQPTKYSSVSFG